VNVCGEQTQTTLLTGLLFFSRAHDYGVADTVDFVADTGDKVEDCDMSVADV